MHGTSMIILVMGVSGVGKTTIGQALAAQLGWRFVDADDFHSPANLAKMHAGTPLKDADREPWLQSLHDAIASWIAAKHSVVLACSALKEIYRQKLMITSDVKLVFLLADFATIAQRLANREGHFMNPALVKSQFDILETPQNAISVDVHGSVNLTVVAIETALALK